ncbi:MAG: NAD(P)-binding domain-containing protein [Candidatus Bathyarchaeota archaeon]|nr:NAD(P)-binding domain-containing protein [Candidatus Bathyarchaeota archaeon]
MKKCKFLVVDGFDEKFYKELSNYGHVTRVRDPYDDSQLSEENILIVRSKTEVDKKLIDKMKSLNLVVTATRGVDHVDVEHLREKGIEFHNIITQVYDVKQGVKALIYAHYTNLIEANESMKGGRWEKSKFIGRQIRNLNLGIIGFGHIGDEVAKDLSKEMKEVFVYEKYWDKDKMKRANEYGVKIASLEELLSKSDVVTIHVPLTSETRHMIGKDEMNKMKDCAFLINTARGEVVDEKALLKALDEGKLSGAGLDVYEHQQPFRNEISKELIRRPNVYATPHSIAQTIEAIDEKGEAVINIIKNHIKRNND